MRELALALFAVLAFLLPVCLYCLVLAAINRRATPLMVSGLWDSIGLLLAGSGFFLATVPILLTEFYLRTLDAAGAETFDELWFRHGLIWLLYYLLLVTGSAFTILWRSHKTVIYNVNSEQFHFLFGPLLDSMGLGATREKQRLIITPALNVKSAGTGILKMPPALSGTPGPTGNTTQDDRYAELEIESFPALCHVTLHWDHYAAEVRQDVEKELAKAIENAAPDDNPVSGWLLSVSGLIFGAIVMLTMAPIFMVLFHRRWE